MIIGLGTDIIEISRVRKIESRSNRLSRRILSDPEMAHYDTLKIEKRRIEYLAGRFAVKEAYSKALGTGIGKSAAFQDVICMNDSKGKPFIEGDKRAHVSISHADEYATATVILEEI
ncbi:holo-ACP synthase [Salinicoccus carnicancri]|uniref:holo-ACP synthase n=1 Tax=Salinicoccus carnicancri TaxID=558170 RepID=UPI0002FB41D1|nr:holo-ACP synthase [Salinicoccus carnicancri]